MKKFPNLTAVLEKSPLVIVKLGAGGDSYDFLPREIRKNIILITLDAAVAAKNDSDEAFLKRIRLSAAIAGSPEPREFIARRYWGCSSCLEVIPDIIKKYGIDSFYEEQGRTAVIPKTLTQILTENNLDHFDLLMTDLEGLDFEIIKSCEPLLHKASLIEAELRFEPCYVGEPELHDVSRYFSEKNFSLIGLKPHFWKPHSSKRSSYTDGIIVIADCLFFREAKEVPSEIIKQAILLSLCGKKNLAAHLLEKQGVSQAISSELAQLFPPDTVKTASLKWLYGQLKQANHYLSRFHSFRLFKRYGLLRKNDLKAPFQFFQTAKPD